MAAFQAKIGWKMPRKRKYKIIIPLRSCPTGYRKFQKNLKILLWHRFKPKQDGNG